MSAAKAGVDALSNVLAAEEGPRGVRSNVIAPGPIADTEGMDRLQALGSLQESIAHVPLQRYGAVNDISNATVFLFSQAANWITGQVIVCLSSFISMDDLSLTIRVIGRRRRKLAHSYGYDALPKERP